MISQIRTPNNNNFKIEYPDNDISVGNQFRKNIYEIHIQQFLENIIKKNDICVDIGTNFGQHTILMAKLAQKVYCVEARNINCNYIRKNILLNSLNNIELIHSGVWNKKCNMTFNFKESNAACSFFSTLNCKQDESIDENVQMTTIDNLFLDLSRLDLLKIDIEGSELFFKVLF
jgi:FkbM family methyltransferase